MTGHVFHCSGVFVLFSVFLNSFLVGLYLFLVCTFAALFCLSFDNINFDIPFGILVDFVISCTFLIDTPECFSISFFSLFNREG